MTPQLKGVRNNQFSKYMGNINEEIIKETFREDSLASSEEGILASQSKSPMVKSSAKINKEGMTAKRTLSRINESINFNDSYLDGFDSTSK